ncbi:Membrane protein, putative, partial [Giardia lamblia P15]
MAGVGNLCHLAMLPQTTDAALISAVLPIMFGILLYMFANTPLLRSVSMGLNKKDIIKQHALLEYGICSGVTNFLYTRSRSIGRVCVVSLICLVFGDGLSSLAALFPSRWQHYRAPDSTKTIAGMLIGCSGAMLGLYLSQSFLGLDLDLKTTQMIIIAISASIIEALRISGEWDNTAVFIGIFVLQCCIVDNSYCKFCVVWAIILMGELCAAKQYLTVHGARAGILVFFTHALAGYEFLAPLSLFVIGSLFASKVFKHRISTFVADVFARNAYQVLSNSYVGLICSLISHIYTKRNRQTLLFLTFINYAEAFADTLASEVGLGLAKPESRVFVLGKLKFAPPGTDGGMSLRGTLVSISGAGAIAYLWCLQGGKQFPEAICIFCLGIQGSLTDSLLGSFFQESRVLQDGRLGRDESIRGAVSLKQGKLRLSNTAVNMLSVLSASLFGLLLVLQGKVL